MSCSTSPGLKPSGNDDELLCAATPATSSETRATSEVNMVSARAVGRSQLNTDKLGEGVRVNW